MIEFPDLPYDYDALTPVISEATLRLHHGKHHARYVDVVNGMLPADGDAHTPLESVIRDAARRGDQALLNNAGQAWNHGFFWASMTPQTRQPVGELASRLEARFGGLEKARDAFVAAGAAHFGSGWVWLAATEQGVDILCTHDGGCMTGRDVAPLLVCDLWEHAYYLDHRNDRAGFLSAWFERLANWPFAERELAAAETRHGRWRYGTTGVGSRALTPKDLSDRLDELDRRMNGVTRRREAQRPDPDAHWNPGVFG